MTGSMNSSNTETNSSKKNNPQRYDEIVNKLKGSVPENEFVFNIALKKLQEDIMEIRVVDEDGQHYENIAVEEVFYLYDPLMKTLKIIVRSEGS